MKYPFNRSILFPVLFLFVASCSRDEGGDHDHSEHEGGEAATNRVDIPSSVRNNLGITFAKVERRSVSTTIRVPGSFELQPLAKQEYRTLLSGQVEFLVGELDEVKAGTLLYRFRSPEWPELQSRIDVARASLEQARSQFKAVTERIEALKAADFKRADLEMREKALQAEVIMREAELQAALNRATRVLNLHNASDEDDFVPMDLLSETEKNGRIISRYQAIDDLEVRAREPGFVESLAVTNGAYVEEAALLLTTIEPSMVRFRALGLQSDLRKFHSAGKVRITPPQAGGADINESIEAGLKIGLTANPDHRTITLFGDPDESRIWMRPGVSAFLEVTTETTGGIVLAIPRSCVVKDGITHVFFKRDPKDANKAIRVEADLGVEDGRWIEVKSGLGPNDEVVLDGAYELKLATSQSGTTQKGGHFHADGTFHADDH